MTVEEYMMEFELLMLKCDIIEPEEKKNNSIFGWVKGMNF
jgi:hypothetical protein